MKKNNSATINVQNLCKSYGAIKAVNNVSFKTNQGEIIALLGPNGAGKSTLMNMIAGFLTPQSGKIEILSCDITKNPVKLKENIGFLPEGAPLYPDFTVKTFLNYMAEIRGLKKADVLKAAKLAQIEEVMQQKNETLSKGYQRRVGFAQSILADPKILLLDEPTDGLDPNQKEYIRNLIAQMVNDKTIIISTHLLEEAETICNRIILMDKGTIKVDGTLKEILKQTKCHNLHDAFRTLTDKE